MSDSNMIQVPVMADLAARGEKPEYLYWVGCAGAFDDRYRKVARAFTRILHRLGISYAVLGKEETCNGDPARRAGNEMLFLMQAMTVIESFKAYEVTKILTTCPHCFNTFKNEYPDLGGNYEVIHHTQFLKEMLDSGRLKLDRSKLQGKRVTFHDPCYLGRGNDIYEEPRELLEALGLELTEMPRNRSRALCCGAGGAQMFKEAEPGDKEVYAERTDEALSTGAQSIATACPFCMVMLTDGLKYKDKAEEVVNQDLAEMVEEAMLTYEIRNRK
jgi:heterodisulfide reductase subunit D